LFRPHSASPYVASLPHYNLRFCYGLRAANRGFMI
jgi:hypothetical protein